MGTLTGKDIRTALGGGNRTEMAPDLAGPEGTTAARMAIKGAGVPTQDPGFSQLPDMAIFRAFLGKIGSAPNEILTNAVQDNPRLLPIVRPYMAGKASLESIAPQLAQEIAVSAQKDPNTAIGEWLLKFATPRTSK